MTFKKLAEYFSQIEQTSSRLKMTEILAELFSEASVKEIGQICYLLQGRVGSLYDEIDFGIADRTVIRALACGLQIAIKDIEKIFKSTGDLGITAERIKNQELSSKGNYITPHTNHIYEVLIRIATARGEGSQDEKIKLLGNLIKEVDPLSSRYIVRILLGKLRLGFSDMTILDSLSWMITKSKELKDKIEQAYNVRPDLGFIAETLKVQGMKGLENVMPKIGIPIRMAKADRLNSGREILEKIGKCAVEFKYDGLRLQVHYKKGNRQQATGNNFVKLYSRNLEDLTPMFPEIVAAVKKSVKTEEAIFEGEVAAYNKENGVSIPFQQTMQRRRKYNIAQKAEEIPVKLYVFELLYMGGENYLNQPYRKRKETLKKIIIQDNVLVYAPETIVDQTDKIDQLFEQSVAQGYEGIIAKRLDGVYQAGMRSWNWIKFKKAMSKKLMDTLDVLVMGYTLGEGKRTSFGVGQFLTGVYDRQNDQYVTISKIGTGLSDEQFRQLKKQVRKLEVSDKPRNYLVDKLLEADKWLRPSLVVEIASDEITRSQIHTAGRVMGPSKSGKARGVVKPGYALRFPRLERFRTDKGPGEVTALSEIEKMYQAQTAR